MAPSRSCGVPGYDRPARLKAITERRSSKCCISFMSRVGREVNGWWPSPSLRATGTFWFVSIDPVVRNEDSTNWPHGSVGNGTSSDGQPGTS